MLFPKLGNLPIIGNIPLSIKILLSHITNWEFKDVVTPVSHSHA
jgi:hypothetical protein